MVICTVKWEIAPLTLSYLVLLEWLAIALGAIPLWHFRMCKICFVKTSTGSNLGGGSDI